MSESIGGTQIFLIVIVLILIFTGIMAYTINHANAFAVKDQIVTILEDAGGLDIDNDIDLNIPSTSFDGYSRTDRETLEKIVNVIDLNSYRSTGKCDLGKIETSSLEGYDDYGSDIEIAAFRRDGQRLSENDPASFCIIKYKAGDVEDTEASGAIDGYHYQVVLFYTLDIPVINQLLNFKALGQTKILYR